ncbi:hypothetical protein ES288_D04G200600v1 [Gossypium darwinii]|uniref:poly(A)-specific ribonuclease n=1 Tax=Gossypium darwinii TaxID=34276 RepID=A0A5D2D2Z8_GOSDA|nr:hypothetical protein ES288_D04G200600v1 [Gossypium darwinii]
MSIFVNKPVIVREVFADNLEYEFMLIQSALHNYSFVSMDTEFPGTIFKPDKRFVQLGNPEVNYRFMKVNVDALKIIQLSLTLSDSEGNLPDFGTPFYHYDKESIELLKRQGIDFTRNKEKGICSRDFGMMVLIFGLGFGELTLVTFHSAYDFGFFLKILTQNLLPPDLKSFMRHLTYYFGCMIFDIKYSFKIFNLHGGLEKVAKTLNVARVAGLSHQAGSDSLLILRCFMQIKNAKAFKQCNQKLSALALYGLV